MRVLSMTACLAGVLAVSGCELNWKWPWSTTGGGASVVVSNNSFNDTVKAEFLNPATPADYFRDMKLLEDFKYVDPDGVAWEVPAGTITNGASVPWGFWNIVGGPYDGPYRDAAVIHDYYVELRTQPWEATNRMFYNAIKARGVSETLALTMYAGVRYGGPRWEVAAAPAPRQTKSALAQLWTIAAAWAGDATPGPETPADVHPAAPAEPPPAPAPEAAATDAKPLEPAETPAPAVRSLGRSMATDEETKNFDELRLWIEREKPSLEQIDKRVEEMRQREGKPAVRVP